MSITHQYGFVTLTLRKRPSQSVVALPTTVHLFADHAITVHPASDHSNGADVMLITGGILNVEGTSLEIAIQIDQARSR